jgi:hypothetical protein
VKIRSHVVNFLGGPNDKQSTLIHAEGDRVPVRLMVDGTTGTAWSPGGVVRRTGVYEESPFGGNVYLWRGWIEEE